MAARATRPPTLSIGDCQGDPLKCRRPGSLDENMMARLHGDRKNKAASAFY